MFSSILENVFLAIFPRSACWALALVLVPLFSPLANAEYFSAGPTPPKGARGAAYSVPPSAASSGKVQTPVARISAEIPFFLAADFADFTRSFATSRDQVRQQLWRELGELALPLAATGQEMTSLSRVLAEILLQFDQMYDVHKQRASYMLGPSLEVQLKAAFEGEAQRSQIPSSQRRAVLVGRGERDLAPAVRPPVDYFAYGIVTHLQRGEVSLELVLEKLISGEQITFSARGSLVGAVASLGRQMFSHFHRLQHQTWENQASRLTWIASPPGLKQTTWAQAALTCAAGRARLPFAQELVLAAAAGPYAKGGVPSFSERQIYAVADRQRHDLPMFYFTSRVSEWMGPVRTDAGFGVISNALFWCVQGPVADSIRFEQQLYRLLRVVPKSRPVIEDLLMRISSLGADNQRKQVTANVEQALQDLEALGKIGRAHV